MKNKKLINGITEYELCERNKQTRLDYLNDCLSLIKQDSFYGDTIEIVNRCVNINSKLDDIEALIMSTSLIMIFGGEGNVELIQELKELKEEGFEYVDRDINGFYFEDDSELIQYAIDNCV